MPLAKINEIGVRPGEKIDEVLITKDNKNVYELKDYFVILPEFKFDKKNYKLQTKAKKVSLDYDSLNNKEMISISQFKNYLNYNLNNTKFYSRQHIDKKDIDSVVNCLKSNYLTTGPLNKIFEKKLINSVIQNIVFL